jgi:hypothetical protein
VNDADKIAVWRMRVGSRIESERLALEISVREAARRAGLTEIVWRQLEAGRTQTARGRHRPVTPDGATKAKAASVFGWSPESLDRLLQGDQPFVLTGRVWPGSSAELKLTPPAHIERATPLDSGVTAPAVTSEVSRAEFDQLVERVKRLEQSHHIRPAGTSPVERFQPPQ